MAQSRKNRNSRGNRKSQGNRKSIMRTLRRTTAKAAGRITTPTKLRHPLLPEPNQVAISNLFAQTLSNRLRTGWHWQDMY